METSEVFHVNSIKNGYFIQYSLKNKNPQINQRLKVKIGSQFYSILNPQLQKLRLYQTQWCSADIMCLEMKMPYSRTSRKAGTQHPPQTTLALLLCLPRQSFHVICLLDHKATQNGVGSFLSLIENVSDLVRITWMVGGKARTGGLMS